MSIEQPRLGSDDDYAKHLSDLTLWEPLARAALELVGLAQPDQLCMPHGLGTYPVLVSEAGLWGCASKGVDRQHLLGQASISRNSLEMVRQECPTTSAGLSSPTR